MTLPVVLDCDPGNDDALGILAALGSPALSLLAVTTGAGHLAAERTARNAAITLAVAGVGTVPVSRGAEHPLVRERLIARVLDFDSALDPERPDLQAVPLSAVTSAEMICAMADRTPGLTVVTTGPLTNLALALRLRPRLIERIARVVTLGGAWGLGNKTAAAEWNMLCDPEAASIVLDSGLPITLLPIDSAAEVTIDQPMIDAVERVATAGARFAGELLRSLRTTFRPSLFGPANMPLNDPLAALVAATPTLARTIPARVDVELAGRHTYGRTVIDFAARSGLPPNCDVAIGYDVDATRRAFIDAVTREPRRSSNP